MVLFSVWTGMFFIRSIVRPIGEIEATAAKIAEGNLDTRIENKYNDEIGKLSDTINHMAGELDKTERMKNEFISSVSHEPVSYTHLDVYKRQVQNHPFRNFQLRQLLLPVRDLSLGVGQLLLYIFFLFFVFRLAVFQLGFAVLQLGQAVLILRLGGIQL